MELDISLRSPKASIVARRGRATLAVLCQHLAWLRAALQSSLVSPGVCLATLSIAISKGARSSNEVLSITVQLAFTVTPLPDHDLSTDPGSIC